MRIVNVFAGAALALAVGAAFAADDKKDPGFNALDKNNDGYVTRAEAAGDKDLVGKFKDADKNGDGKLNRAEYLVVKGKEDVANVTDKVTNKVNKERAEHRAAGGTGAAAGASADAGSKPARANQDRKDPGFNALDKDNDGYVTRAEAAGDKDLVAKFKDADKNNDGKLNRAEYLTVKAKEDANTVKNKVGNAVDRAEARAERRGDASTGTTARPAEPAKNQSNN